MITAVNSLMCQLIIMIQHVNKNFKRTVLTCESDTFNEMDVTMLLLIVALNGVDVRRAALVMSSV